MVSDQARELRLQGIAAAKAGQRDQARKLLQQSLRLEPRNESAWMWLVSVTQDPRERQFCLQKVLEINPANEMALKGMQALGVKVSAPGAPLPDQPANPQLPVEAAPSPVAAAAPAATQAPGVPIPDAERLAEVQREADELMRAWMLSEDSMPDIKWVHKTRKRAGEADATRLRMAIGGAVAGVILVIGIISAIVISSNPALVGVVVAPTFTISPIPTNTPTNTPGFTPTPSPTPELTVTPSPTVPPEIQRGNVNSLPEPTDVYPFIQEAPLRAAVVMLEQGNAAAVLPTIAAERAQTTARFDPNPYYYEALAAVRSGDGDRALRVLQEAEGRLTEVTGTSAKALIDTGYAQVYLTLAETALQEDGAREAQPYLDIVRERASTAVIDDPRLVQAYIALSRAFSLGEDYDQALQVLNDALVLPQLASDTNLIVEKGELYLKRGEPDLAAYQAFLALYVDPASEPAYLLQIRSDLAKGDPGLAVIHTQNYLFYYPGSSEGYLLLGNARSAEGNTDQALAAYTQALSGGNTTSATVDVLLARADLFSAQRRYEAAREDLTRALNLRETPQIQVLRMRAAYGAQNYSIAQDDAEELMGSGVVPDDELRLILARIRIDQADASDASTYESARAELQELDSSVLTDSQAADLHEYLARANFQLQSYAEALRTIDDALSTAETGTRRYLRGQILEAQGEVEDALREYEWVLTWGQVYPYPFLNDVRERAEALRQSS